MGHDANPSFAVKSYTSLPTLTPPPFAILINVVLQALKDINFAAIRVLAAHDLQVVSRTCPTYFIINSSVILDVTVYWLYRASWNKWPCYTHPLLDHQQV